MHSVALAATHHDPDERLLPQLRRVLPLLTGMFGALAIHATDTTSPAAIELLSAAGATVRSAPAGGYRELGRARRGALEAGLGCGLPHVLLCDLDRALHWAEVWPEELAGAVAAITAYDFTVLGRTPRAFDSHPLVQRDTEVLVNRVFAQAFGQAWDVTAAARGVSQAAGAAIVAGCPDDSIGTDVSWPLFLRRRGGLSLGYRATEGLEFETPDRYPDEVAAAGGREAWTAQLDASPRAWALRLAIAQIEVEAALPYVEG